MFLIKCLGHYWPIDFNSITNSVTSIDWWTSISKNVYNNYSYNDFYQDWLSDIVYLHLHLTNENNFIFIGFLLAGDASEQLVEKIFINAERRKNFTNVESARGVGKREGSTDIPRSHGYLSQGFIQKVCIFNQSIWARPHNTLICDATSPKPANLQTTTPHAQWHIFNIFIFFVLRGKEKVVY